MCGFEGFFVYFSIIHTSVTIFVMIGIFDSGYGGLTIMKEIVRELPQYDYFYLGDNARTPYGNRGRETVTQFTEEGIRFLFDKGAELVVIACFVASSLALRQLQEKYLRNPKSPFRGKKILGVIRPVVEKAAADPKIKRIGVAATRSTVNSGSFDTELKNLRPDMTILSQACPLLVPFIEEHWHTRPEARMILKKYLLPLKNKNVDALIPGCTHYPVMMQDFKHIMGKRVNVLNPGQIVAESLKEYLERHPEIEKKLTRGKNRMFSTTDDPARFSEFVKTFWPGAAATQPKIQKVNLIPIQ